MDESKAVELYRKHRPRRLSDVVGQDAAVAQLEEMLKRDRVPRVLMFCGPSGCGKNTLAYILRRRLRCSERDFQKINGAEARGIDTVRDIQQRMMLAPMAGDCRVWFIDECHRLTNDSQSALLETLEDTPSHVYFMLATTDPGKVIKTVRGRCTEVVLKMIGPEDLEKLVRSVLIAEKRELSKLAVSKLAEVAEGSARKALVLLHQILDLPGDKERLAVLERGDRARTAYELARLLVWDRGVTWAKVAEVIAGLEDDDWEGLRRLVLSCATKDALKPSGSGRAIAVIEAFSYAWYDTGRAGLVRACHDVVNAKR